ncbi:methionyl-tRNA formyltransferase [Maridesulfovibrio zosterae]|uniref:methionyl-tRNA formyltransferase n=1 Tax=Maridesulfovibrio zosterae TaxID=82171 RepID=UPI0003F8FE30|nr:formyltransferase family protein [Maridesulfovibrio zosterae]
MKIAIIGRTRTLLDTARLLHKEGVEIPLIWTYRDESHYGASISDFENLAKELKADFYTEFNICSPKNIERIRRYGCELAISINWISIINKDLIDVFPNGILNAHMGDLPRYKGNAVPNWAILNQEDQVGLCIHQMTPELDSGPIVKKDFFKLTDNTYISEVYDWFHKMSPRLFLDSVKAFKIGNANNYKQSSATRQLRCFPRRPEDSRIDWNQSVDAIHRLIRASSKPFSGAFSFLEGQQKITIWKATPYKYNGDFSAVPGQVCFSINNNPVIACKGGMLMLQDVSVDGTEDHVTSSSLILKSLRNRLI